MENVLPVSEGAEAFVVLPAFFQAYKFPYNLLYLSGFHYFIYCISANQLVSNFGGIYVQKYGIINHQ